MKKAEEILHNLGYEGYDEALFHIIDDLDASDIVFAFEEKLDSMGFENILVEVAIDDEVNGILVRFEDEERDDVLVQFTFDDEANPIVSVVSEEDEQITIDLSALAPPAIEVGSEIYLDLLDLSWMNKSTLGLLLKAGKVGPDPKPEPAIEPAKEVTAETFVAKKPLGKADELFKDTLSESGHPVLGGKKMKLPVVRVKDKMTDSEKKTVKKAKSIGMLK